MSNFLGMRVVSVINLPGVTIWGILKWIIRRSLGEGDPILWELIKEEEAEVEGEEAWKMIFKWPEKK